MLITWLISFISFSQVFEILTYGAVPGLFPAFIVFVVPVALGLVLFFGSFLAVCAGPYPCPW